MPFVRGLINLETERQFLEQALAFLPSVQRLLDFDQAVSKLTQETNFRVSPMVIEAIRSQF